MHVLFTLIQTPAEDAYPRCLKRGGWGGGEGGTSEISLEDRSQGIISAPATGCEDGGGGGHTMQQSGLFKSDDKPIQKLGHDKEFK